VALIVGSTLGVGGQRHRAKVSTDLLTFESRRTTSHARVIVRGSRMELEALASRHGVRIAKFLGDSAVLLANSAQVSALAGERDVLSGDLPVGPFMDVSTAATAADQVRAGEGGLLLGLGGIPGVTGAGVTVAVLDTGISAHPALTGKVIASVSKVAGDPSTNDAHGHGTHIAGIIAGNSSASKYVTPLYRGGIAPDVKLVNVRVLGANGTGWTSDVIDGIEWVIENRNTYKIRMINLSLGHPVTEPSTTDPLCIAVAKATAAGIVVVVSAGNAGKDENGTPILGGISSPGNSPFAITVGAVNTKGTVSRADDIMTTYSSRGPTKFEHAVKPDVVAPGNKVVSLETAGSYLQRNYSQFHMAGTRTNAYMHLSGTSMSAAIVTGGVALLMQAHPNISAGQVKIALQTGATYMKDGGLFGGGAGSVNFWTTRKMAANGLTNLLSTVVGGVLSPAGGMVFWDSGSMMKRLYAGTGLRVLSLVEAPIAWLTGDSYFQWGQLNILGLTNPLAQVRPHELMWGDVSKWTADQELMWGDQVFNPEGQELMWGDSRTIEGEELMWGDSLQVNADQ
ncbi:MAG TPA: S8 family peptidase, partial [Vicinamibacterales bacterium]|nr:S8 family peptidase [Vicinamibacterales bacterium]